MLTRLKNGLYAVAVVLTLAAAVHWCARTLAAGDGQARPAPIPAATVPASTTATVVPLQAATPTTSPCPLDSRACEFAGRIDSLLQRGDLDAVLTLVQSRDIECDRAALQRTNGLFT